MNFQELQLNDMIICSLTFIAIVIALYFNLTQKLDISVMRKIDKLIMTIILLALIVLVILCPCDVIISCHMKTYIYLVSLLSLYVIYINYVRKI